MHGESTGLFDDALVCYVEFYGTFRTGSAPEGEPTERTGTAQQVFDAHTGNLLVAGDDAAESRIALFGCADMT